MAAVPWTDLAMDFLTELPIVLGKSTVLVVVDRFSKMLRLIPLGEQTDTESVACIFFDHMVHIHGLPWTIISDRNLKVFGINLDWFNICHGYQVTIFNCVPSSNGWIE